MKLFVCASKITHQITFSVRHSNSFASVEIFRQINRLFTHFSIVRSRFYPAVRPPTDVLLILNMWKIPSTTCMWSPMRSVAEIDFVIERVQQNVGIGTCRIFTATVADFDLRSIVNVVVDFGARVTKAQPCHWQVWHRISLVRDTPIRV